MFKFVKPFLTLLALLGLVWGIAPTGSHAVARQTAEAPAARTSPLIIDHTTRDLTRIPQTWIEQAKANLHLYYGHTSHGSQLMDGTANLVGFANGGGLGLSLPTDIFSGLPIDETSPDAGYYPDWVNNTRDYLGTPDSGTGRGTSHPEINVVMWSWCGQLSWMSADEVTNNYLNPMNQLETDYPGITFVYFTGHSDGSDTAGTIFQRNQQIRQYATANNKVLYDFNDIELYDPDGNYYGDKLATDNCDYDSDGDGSQDKNWCTDWQSTHTENVDWYSTGCAHSQSLNCNQKAYAAWWLWARLAGWNGSSSTDTEAPSVPANLDTPTISFNQVHLSWDASSDNQGGSGVAGYRIYRDSVEIDTSVTTSYTDTTVIPGMAYHYTVAAYDGAGNQSAQSASIQANIPEAPFVLYLPFTQR